MASRPETAYSHSNSREPGNLELIPARRWNKNVTALAGSDE